MVRRLATAIVALLAVLALAVGVLAAARPHAGAAATAVMLFILLGVSIGIADGH